MTQHRRWTLRLCGHCDSWRTLAVGAFRVRCDDCRGFTERPEAIEVMPVLPTLDQHKGDAVVESEGT